VGLHSFREYDREILEEGLGADVNVVIAIDGPAGSGKGTLARQLAKRFGYTYLDTGALYRAVALALLEANGSVKNERDLEVALNTIKKNLTPELLKSNLLRTEDVSQMASKVAAEPFVRKALFDIQRDFAANPPNGAAGAVLDGRDIGSVVYPHADIKIFVTASPEVRAERRYKELQLTGTSVDYDVVLAEIVERDERDKNREASPMVVAEDAFVLDTSSLDAPEAFSHAMDIIRAQFIDATDEK